MYTEHIEDNSTYVVSKSRYKYGNLQVYGYMSNDHKKSSIWQYIPKCFVTEITKELRSQKVPICGSLKRYVKKLQKYF